MRRLFIILLLLAMVRLPVTPVIAAPAISNINTPFICNTSVLVNFRTDVPTHAYIEYGTTMSYGTQTINDTVRYYTEHAIQLTGLAANTQYHFRINATNDGVTQSANQTVTTASSGATCAALPAQVDSRMPDMTGAVERTVKASGGDYTPAQFQTALNDAGTANEKRIITVDAGLTLTGNYTFPVNADQNWIIVRTSAHADLPEGQRVFPDNSGSMFRIRSNNLDPPIATGLASNHIRLIGAEVTIDPAALGDAPAGATQSAGMISFTWNLAGNPANLARFIGIDRCYVHGQPNKNTLRGIEVSGEDIFIVDSYVDEFHHKGFDAQGILGLAVKRWKILNNTVIGSGESFMWGGAGIGLTGYVIGELEYLRNHMYMPLAWKVSNQWTEKNLFECKTCSKVLGFGNYFGGVTSAQGGFWPDAQSLSVNIKLEQNSGGPATCDLMQDITFYKNFGRNIAAGVAVTGRTNPAQGCTNLPDRVTWRDNVFEMNATVWTPDPGCTSCSWNATGWFLAGTTNLNVHHNTWINATPTQSGACNSVFGDGMMLLVGDPVVVKVTGFVFQDNIADWRGCGVSGGGFNGTNGTGSLNGVYTGWVFRKNGIMRAAGAQANFPAENIFATTWPPQLVNFNNGSDGNYRVAGSSSWANAASDGTDIGADVGGATAASVFAPTGIWPQNLETTRRVTISGKATLRGKVVIQ
jgi:hypothetical protein